MYNKQRLNKKPYTPHIPTILLPRSLGDQAKASSWCSLLLDHTKNLMMKSSNVHPHDCTIGSNLQRPKIFKLSVHDHPLDVACLVFCDILIEFVIVTPLDNDQVQLIDSLNLVVEHQQPQTPPIVDVSQESCYCIIDWWIILCLDVLHQIIFSGSSTMVQYFLSMLNNPQLLANVFNIASHLIYDPFD